MSDPRNPQNKKTKDPLTRVRSDFQNEKDKKLSREEGRVLSSAGERALGVKSTRTTTAWGDDKKEDKKDASTHDRQRQQTTTAPGAPRQPTRTLGLPSGARGAAASSSTFSVRPGTPRPAEDESKGATTKGKGRR